MENTTHSQGLIPVSLSKLLERMGYYGMRSILVLYMVKQLGLSDMTASSTYGIFTGIAGFLPVLGGLIGDLIISSKLTAIIGGFMQAFGCFTLVLPGTAAMYAGLFLIALGTGLYSPNVVSTLSSLYKSRTEKLDAAMLILYACINLGAFLAPLIIATTSEVVGFQVGFSLAGVLMIGSSLTLLLFDSYLKDTPVTPNIYLEEKKEANTGSYVLIVITTVLSIPVFWITYEMINSPVYMQISKASDTYPWFYRFYSAINPITTILVGIILAVIYSFMKASSLLKIMAGFIIYGISCVIIGLYSQGEINDSFVFFILSATFLQAIGELFISPIAMSVICNYGSARFNSTLIGAYLGGSTVFYYLTSYLAGHMGSLDTISTIILCLAVMLLFSGVFLTLYLVTKKKNTV